MNRLTNRKAAEALRQNCEGLLKKGIKPDQMYLEYIKLAEYENKDEDLLKKYEPEEWFE